MEKSVAEVLDGYSIAKLKNVKIPSEITKKIFETYCKELDIIKNKYPQYNWDMIVKSFEDVNSTIWKYEAGIRQGLVDDDPMIVYTRAILVREFNRLRVGLGNIVSILIKQEGMLNLKKEHASA